MKRKIILVALSVLMVSSVIGICSVATLKADDNSTQTSKYEKPTVQDITGLGSSPYELSSSASAMATEKQWYEYITYCNQPVGQSEVDSNTRLVFYDPYSYTNATIMELQGEDNEWSSANTYTESYTTSDSETWGDSTTTTETESITGTNADGIIQNKESGIHNRNSKWTDISTSDSASAGMEVNAEFKSLFHAVDIGFSMDIGRSTTTTEIADRFSRQYGVSKNRSHSSTKGTSETITRTFNAAYFNQYGSPLQWKVVMYEVFLPLKVEMQKKDGEEWYTVDTAYCKLKTLDGLSRAYIKDNKTYIEDWGTGEPVLWEDFENSFFNEEKLVAAYKDKLYPNK